MRNKNETELIICNKELVFQNKEKEKHAAELIIAKKELVFQNEETEKRAKEFIIINSKLKETDEKLKKISHLYAFISQINQNITRINDQETLFRNACSIALKYGKFKMAWIGMFDNAGKKITNVEHCGMSAEAVSLFFSVLENINSLQEPVVKKGIYYVCNDIKQDFPFGDMKVFMAEQQLLSCMILPIKKSGQIIGTFNLYASELNFFDKEEISLLVELTGDISFALELFEKAKKQKETEELVVQNENRFRSLIEKSSDMKTLSTRAGKILYASPSIHKVLGYTNEEYLNKYPYDIIHPDDITRYVEERNKVLQTQGKSFHFEQQRLHKNGAWIWCEGTVTNMLDEPGVNALVSNFRDITERKKAEKTYLRLASIVESSGDAIISLSLEGLIISWNQTAKNLYEYSPEEVIGKPYAVLLHYDNAGEFAKKIERLKAGEQLGHFESKHLLKNGKLIYISLSISPVKDTTGRLIGISTNARDITEQKRVEYVLNQTTDKEKDRFKKKVKLSLAIGLILALLVLFFSVSFDLPKKLVTEMANLKDSIYDDLLVMMALLFLIGIAFGFLIYIESRKGGRIIQNALRTLTKELEKRVHERTNDLSKSNEVLLNEIIERKKVEQNLVRNESSLKEAQALGHIGNFEKDMQADIELWSDEFYKIFGLVKGETEPSSEAFLSLVHPEDKHIALKKIKEGFETFNNYYFSCRFIRKNSQIINCYAECKFEFDNKGNPIRLFGIMQDITERTEAEANLKALENKIVEDKIKTQQEITDAIITGQERERSFLGQELHDNINQILAASKLYLEVAIADDSLRKDIMTDSRNYIISAMEEIRKLSKSLLPPTLGEASLQDALSELIELLEEVNKLKFIKEWEGIDENVLSEKMSLTIFRIVQEQLNNILKHANAKTVIIGLKQEAGTFQLKIKDDGVGFDTSAIKKGIGLKNITSRADSLKGKVVIHSRPGEGCELILKFSTSMESE